MATHGLMGKRIPTLVGVLILLGGLFAGVILVNNHQGLLIKAGPTEAPKNVKISNLGSNTFTVSWTTDTPVTGYLKYSEDPTKINTPAGDIRDQISGNSQAYTNHYVTVTGVNPDKTDYFMIGSGSQMYDDSGKPFQVRILQQVIAPPEDVITGKVIGADGSPINNAIVYIDAEGSQTLSAMTKADGTWRLNLALSRGSTGEVLTYDPATTLVSIFVEAGISGTATAITDTAKDKPVPDIVLGKNQSFIDTTAATGSGAIDEGTVKTGGFQSITEQAAPVATGSTVTTESQIITYPGIDGEMIATSSPQFAGKTAPGTSIRITVHSATELTQVIKADKNGQWAWTPPQGLDPGIHTITLEYTDANNVFQQVVRSFTVLAADDTGGIPAFTATPSATVTISPTGTPSLTPTMSPSMPATTSGNLTSTGAVDATIIMGVAGLMLFIFGRVSKKWWKD